MRSGSLARSAFFLLVFATTSSAQPYVYVSGAGADSIGVVDLQTNALLETFPLAGLPSGLVVAPNGTLFVARSGLDSVARIDPVTGATTSIAVGSRPCAVAVGVGPNPEPVGRHLPRVFVANGGADTVSVIDPLAGTVLATIPVGDAPIDLAAGGTRLYVANWGAASVTVIDTLTNVAVATVGVGRQPVGLVVDPRTGRAYVASFFDDTISVIDPSSASVIATVPVSRGPRGLALDPAAGRLYVAGFADGTVDVVSTVTHTVLQQAPSGGPNPTDLLLGPGGQRLYAAHLTTGQALRVLDASTLAPLASIAAPAGPVGLAGFGRQAPAPRHPTRGAAMLDAIRTAWSTFAPRIGSSEHRSRPDPANATITDGTFAPGDWDVFSSVGPSQTVQETIGGNPGSWRRTTHFPAPAAVATLHRLIHSAKQYDPATQGPIATLDATWDHRHLTPATSSYAFAVVQDGVAYWTDERSATNDAWQGILFIGLTAADFDDGSGGQPDFGASGGVIRFGYLRRTLPSDGSVVHGIDNFRVNVQTGGGGSPGSAAFRITATAASDAEPVDITVDRLGGSAGSAGVHVVITSSTGEDDDLTLFWSDGDASPRTFPLPPEFLETGEAVSTVRLRLASPVGGLAIGARDTMSVLVYPEGWTLGPMVLALLILLSESTPGFLAVLAVPALLLVLARRRRSLA